MLGINYESSDEEEVASPGKPQVRHANTSGGAPIATNIELSNAPPTIPAPKPAPAPVKVVPASPGPVNGPAQGPSVSPSPVEANSHSEVAPGSPYTTNRAIIQTLTLPTVPNFDIPPSPPGSPPQRSSKKFAQFLELKKKGQHFNQRLENSPVMRDPNHQRKLMDFAGIGEEDQYVSTLSDDVAVPSVFPEWAYMEELRASQKKISKAREQDRSRIPRESIDFVAASGSGASSSTGTPSGKGLRQSAAERVMAGLDQQQSSLSSSQNTGKRKDLEHRGRSDSSRNRSRSPKRRRSKSRDRR